MTAFDWTPLRRALAKCRRENVPVPMWWRDDDAIAMTPALKQLTEMSERTGVPVHLAIIPAHVDPDLPKAIDTQHIRPVVHGWAHADHSSQGTKKNEFLTPRKDAVQDVQAAFEKMTALFGSDLRRMFVPPWNRISDDVIHALAKQGCRALSTYGARSNPRLAGLDVVNTHVDPIWWKGSRDLVDPDTLIAEATAHLMARAVGHEDSTEPFGLLTHHLVHSPAIWSFAEAFLVEMQSGGATLWSMENDR